MQNSIAADGHSTGIPRTLNTEVPHGPAVLLRDIYLKGSKAGTYRGIGLSQHCYNSQNTGGPGVPINGWVNQGWAINTELVSLKEIQVHATSWMMPGNIMFGKQASRDDYCIMLGVPTVSSL